MTRSHVPATIDTADVRGVRSFSGAALAGSSGMVSRLSLVLAVVLITNAPQAYAASDLFQTSPIVVPPPIPGGKPLSLSGCVPADANASIADASMARRQHRNIAKTTIDVLGRKVLVFGRFVPSTNVAAQMGALDPPVVAAAMAVPAARGYGDNYPPARRTTGAMVLSSPARCAVR